MAKPVGFIGLGRMGLRMVTTLVRGGAEAIVYDASPEALGRAAELEGVTAAASGADLAARCGVVFTALPNNDIVRAVYLGEKGIREGGQPGLVTCDCSTVGPEVSEELHGLLAAKSIHHLDTPMLGSTPQAETGEIFFIVAGDEAHLPTVAPYLEIMGKGHRFVGPPGTANKMKLMHNVLGAINAVAVSEILAMGVKAEVNLKDFYDVVCNGGGQAYSTYFKSRAMRVAEGNFDPTFTVELMNKDVNMAVELAERLGGPLNIMQATKAAYNRAVEEGWDQEDFSAVTHLAEQKIGRTLSGK